MKSNIYFYGGSREGNILLLFLVVFIFWLVIYLFLALGPFREESLKIHLYLAGSVFFLFAFMSYMFFLGAREESWMTPDKIIYAKTGWLPTCKKISLHDLDEIEIGVEVFSDDNIVSSSGKQAVKEQVSQRMDNVVAQLASYSEIPDKKWRKVKIHAGDKKYNVRLVVGRFILRDGTRSKKLIIPLQNHSKLKTLLNAVKEKRPRITWRFDGFGID